MKIVIFTDTYAPEINGVVTSINTFSDLLAKEGHEILIIAPKYKGQKDKKTKNVKVVRYPAISFASNRATRLAFPRLIDLTRQLREFRPDLFYIQTPANLGVVGIILSKTLGIPNVQTYHTYLPELAVYFDVAKVFGLEKIPEIIDSHKVTQKLMSSDFYDYLMRSSGNKSLGEFIGIGKKKESPNYDLTIKMIWSYTRWIYNRADIVLTPSNTLAKILKKHKIKPPVFAQTNGLWVESIPKKKSYKSTGRIIHFGRLGHEKRVDVVIQAFSQAQKNYSKLRLDIYGDGPAKKELLELSRKLGQTKNIKFFGFVPRENIINKLCEYDLFVTASPMETQGMVVLEAMAAGLPIVGVNKLAVPEVVKSGRNGYIVPEGGFEKMAEKILIIAKDEKLQKKMGEKSIDIAKEHDMIHAFALLLDHFKQAIS